MGWRIRVSWSPALRARLAMLFLHAREDREMDEELDFHIQMATEANLRRGMTPTRPPGRRASLSEGRKAGEKY